MRRSAGESSTDVRGEKLGDQPRRRAVIAAGLRMRIQRVRGTMSDELFDTLIERMTDQRIADELRGERP